MITRTAKIDIEQAHLPWEEKMEFKEYIMNTEGSKQYLERRRVGICARTLIS